MHTMFYSKQVSENRIILDEQESRHARQVYRLHKGDTIAVTDGSGTIYSCIIDEISNGLLQLHSTGTEQVPELPVAIHAFLGLPDRDSFEIAIEHCTALGVKTFTPVICSFSQKQWWDKNWEKQTERFNKILISSMKQCLHPYLPVLHPPIVFAEALNAACNPVAADICGIPVGSFFARNKYSRLDIFIGPPGGFSPEEVSLLCEKNVPMLKIAYTRLRTELAAIAMTSAVVSQVLGDLSE